MKNTFILETASRLVSDGNNPEYDRALVELTVDLIGLDSSSSKTVAALIGVAPRKAPSRVIKIEASPEEALTRGQKAAATRARNAAAGKVYKKPGRPKKS